MGRNLRWLRPICFCRVQMGCSGVLIIKTVNCSPVAARNQMSVNIDRHLYA